MSIAAFFTTAADWWQRLDARIEQARHQRRSLQELRAMTAHELRDVGISPAPLAHPMRREPRLTAAACAGPRSLQAPGQ